MAYPIDAPFPLFADLAGNLVDGGFLWFGAANQDPQSVPQTIYWDAALTQPAQQPVRTLNGVPVRNGAAANLYINRPYSERLQDQRGVTIYTKPMVTSLAIALETSGVLYLDAVDTVADMTVLPTAGLTDGVHVMVSGRVTAHDGGGGLFYWDATSTATTDFGTVFDPVPLVTGRWKRAVVYPLNAAWFGTVSDGNIGTGAGTDNFLALQRFLNALGFQDPTSAGVIPPGVFKCTQRLQMATGRSIAGAGKWQTIILAPAAFADANGLLDINGAGGPPSAIKGLGIIAQVGGAAAGSLGLNVRNNGTFVSDIWVSGFAINVSLNSSDVFLSDFAVEEARSGGTGILVVTTSVSISNGTVYNCYIGINAMQVNSTGDVVLVSNVRAAACAYASYISSGNGTHFNNCTATHNNVSRMDYAGFYITGSYNKVIGCTVTIDASSVPHPNGIGFRVDGPGSDLILQGNSCRRMFKGFVINTGASARVVCVGNSASENKVSGFEVTGCAGMIFSNNYSSDNGTGIAGDVNIKLNSTTAFALWTVTGNFAVQPGGGPAPIGFDVNLTNNGASSGKMNFGLNASEQHTTDYNFTGLLANITQTANI